ncbi:MAG: polymer-forming cytoskeletal protein [Planctomycetes bacterium]|nr:polymer-forming cytoskeletal protein [Planctomycetota bacterium]
MSARSAQRPQKASAAETASKLNPNLKFEGTLHYTGTVLVDCEFRGSIVTDDSLVVGPNADIEAELTAGLVEVSGKVRGNISAKRSVRILSGGEVHGNIETPTIAMEEGVVFEGNCTRPSGPAAPGRSYTAETPRSQPVHEESSTEKAESFSVS